MRAEIVSVGTELLLGTITDTNSAYLAQRLAALGVDCFHISQIGDNLGRLVETLKRGWERSELIITTGGLGPTGDDITREAVAELLGESMKVEPALEAELRAFFVRRGVTMPEANLKQATLIPSAQTLPNPIGTAPGWWVTRHDVDLSRSIISMPGVPYEMKRMWEHEVEPQLRSYSTSVLVSRTLKVLGLGESAVADQVNDLMAGSNPTVAPYAKQDGIHLRITARASDVASAEPLIANLEEVIRSRLGAAIYGADNETPQGVVRGLLSTLGYSCALIEIGSGAAGALSSLLAGANDHLGDPVVGLVSVPEVAGLGSIMSELKDGAPLSGISEAAKAVKIVLGTNVVLVVAARLVPDTPGSRIVSAEADLVLLTPGDDEQDHITRVQQTWKTDILEVRRLVGLVALNLMRLRLLKIQKTEV